MNVVTKDITLAGEDWIIDHMDFMAHVTEEDWVRDKELVKRTLRLNAIRQIVEKMVDLGYGKVESEQDVARCGYIVTTRIKFMRPKE